MLVCVDSRPRFSLTPCIFASRILLHPTVMLVVQPVRRWKPRFCQIPISSSSFSAQDQKWLSLIPRASSTRGIKRHGENAASMTWIWWIPLQGLTKIPHSNGKQRWEDKPNSWRPSKLVTISAYFSRCISALLSGRVKFCEVKMLFGEEKFSSIA